MANYYLCVCLLRVALPVCLTLSIIFRPCLLSAFYLLLLLYVPFVPVPTQKTMQGHTGHYLKITISISVITTVAQFAFQIVLLSLPTYGHFLKNCQFLERVLRHVGFIRLDGMYAKDIVQWLSPEIIMLFVSVFTFILCGKFSERLGTPLLSEEGEAVSPKPKKKKYGFILVIGRYLSLASLAIAAVLRPSVPGAFYFMIFIGCATWWSCCKELRRGYAIVCRMVMVVLFFHICTLFTYQFQWPQEFLDANSTYARYFGLTAIMSYNCDDPRVFLFNDMEWATFLNPIWLLWLYYILAVESRLLLRPQVKKEVRTPSEKTPLIRGVSPSRKYGTKSSSVLQDSTGSVTITGEGQDDIPMQPLEEDLQSSVFENMIFGFASVFQVLVRSSYIATNITMMAWSITYHSWLTFVLLLWANLLWLLPNQRRAMLRSAPFLVIYAEFLLLSAYVYCMNLTEDELPSTIQNINLAQIGFEKITVLPCKPLLVKCLYTTMFWITLRQFMHERQEAKQTSTLADIVAPLQVTVGTATTSISPKKEPISKSDQIMKKIGEVLKKFLTKTWIWIVAINLFVVAITGDRMTGFRIIYMFLFLFFILTFQLSFTLWRKIMLPFWLTVIGYSMLTLVLVYTYQFDHFPDYWTEYLKIPKNQQADIGLEKFETKQLFVRLLTPTFFVVITVIQVHYFHKDFLEISAPAVLPVNATENNQEPVAQRRSDASSAQIWDASEKTETTITSLAGAKFHLKNIKNKEMWMALGKHWGKKIVILYEYMWLYLELHMFKIVTLVALLMCVYDICAIHMVILLLFTTALTFGQNIQGVMVHLSSIIVSIMLLAKMIYQIQYIDHSKWDVHCQNATSNNTAYNNAVWLGFQKIRDNMTLPSLVKWYIGFILVVMIRAIAGIRQHHIRVIRGKSRQYFMFPKITRKDADKNILYCIKYLFNYGFYKFGIEICLMSIVALIGTRMDLYAVFHGIWLCIMFSMNRKQLNRIWTFYLGFIAILLPVQYFMVVGLPPGLCINYPWDNNDLLRRIQDWMFLLDSEIDYRPSAKKLLCDIFLLILVSRQAIVFRIENRWAREQSNREYPGGSNESIIHRAEEPGFVNPVPDFVTYVRSWLDIFKRGILQSFMWITLAIVFLAGTNRVNLFSIGYLIGSFIFLWQGSDLYLKSIPNILKSWNGLLGYNVAVIVLKAFLQIIGCIFIKDVELYACWFVQLLGIGCIQKFDVSKKGFSDADCTVPREDIGLAWDGVCFAFLILQRRLFNSYNFFHIIDESKAATILASRGAELIEELRERQMAMKADEEGRILEKIKQKMDKIKANQQRIQGPSFKDATSHYVAIRSGDYYMFDDLEDEEELEFITEKEDDDDGLLESEREASRKKRSADARRTTVQQLLDDVMKTNFEAALKRTESDVSSRRPRVSRRASMPLARQRSNISTRSRLSAPLPILFKGESPRRVERQTVTIYEESKRDDDQDKYQPKPGSSKQPDEEISLLSEEESIRHETKWRKFVNCLLFIWAFLESCMNTATNYLNKFSRDYRYVLRVLTKEKRLLKEKTQFTIGVRKGSTQIWEPIGSFQSLVRKSRVVDRGEPEKIFQPELVDGQSGEKTPQTLQDSKKDSPESPTTAEDQYDSEQMDIMEDYEGAEMSSVDQPPFIRLLHAIWFVILSHSDIVCYFMIFLNQIKSPTILSLPLPLMVFLWGTLTIPRPSKTFWITIIAYTEVIVLVKCMFQFELLPWNQNNPITSSNPFYAPKILGIERKPQYAIYDLLVLLVVFFHRFMLKTLGLWKSTVEQSYTSESQIFTKQQEDISQASKVSSRISSKERGLNDTDVDHSEISRLGLVQVKTTEIEPMSNVKESLKLASSKYSENYRKFFKQLLDPTSRITVDVYAYMFMCDFFNFMVLIFGFAAFGSQQGDGGVSAYLQENKVPIPFLLMLILQFVLIIVDRALFLRKYILGKIVFQFLQILGVHIWMFFVLPAITERNFNANLPPQMWYMVKSFYLLLSAYQIRCGYPTRILGNFLCKGYNYVNMFLFKVFMAIPFLFELRTIMDWMWTDTSMTIFDWLKMEDIFAHIFQLKCSRHVETEYPQPRGEKKSPMVKYFMGGAGLFGIIAVIWFPLVFFALGSTVGQANVPYDVTVNMRIGPYQNIFSMSAQTNAMFKFSPTDFISMRDSVYKKNRVAQTFLSFYEYDDIAAVKLNGNSTMVWAISPPDMQRMIEEVQSMKPVVLKLQYIISRTTNNKQEPGVITGEQEVVMDAEVNGILNPERQKLLSMLQGNVNASAVFVRNLFPKFVKVTNRGTATPVTQLMSEGANDIQNSLRNLTMKLSRSNATPEISSQMWWELREDCNDGNYERILKYLPQANCEYLMMYTFNEKSFPASLSFLSGGGIIGLYTTLVFVVSRMIRGFFSEICFKIMFDDMPNVDRILQLCLDIYLVREARELCLEEDLFAKLVFLFRSPETLIKWTRPKEDDENEGIDPDEEPPQIDQ